MAVSVLFPDGTVRDIPAQLRPLPSTSRRAPEFEQVPLNCDPCWKYERRGSAWFARPRRNAVLALKVPAKTWWHAIEHMAESYVNPCSLAQDDPATVRETSLKTAA